MNPLPFNLNLAYLIVINDYQNGIPALGTARQDAEAITLQKLLIQIDTKSAIAFSKFLVWKCDRLSKG
jgi:hypothetical protein